MAQEIQDGLEDVDNEEKKLEERGKQVEETIKKQRPGWVKQMYNTFLLELNFLVTCGAHLLTF